MSTPIKVRELELLWPRDSAVWQLIQLAKAVQREHAAENAMREAPLATPPPDLPPKVAALARYAPPYSLYRAFEEAQAATRCALQHFDFTEDDDAQA